MNELSSPAAIRARHPRTVLIVLFTGAFVMGCAEMLVVGLIELIAADKGVSLSDAGALVTANALGLALGGPLLTLLLTRVDRRVVGLVALTVFVLANLLPVLGATFVPFLVARVVIGAVQGLFIAAAMTISTSIVPAQRRGRAMALVISGFATASAIGLPLGTLLGQAVGWRGAFATVVALAAVVLLAAAAVLPSVPSSSEHQAAGQARAAFSPPVLAILGLCALVFVAIQSLLTYVVPFLGEVSGVAGPAVGVFLLAYGLSTTVGSAVGGRFADTGAPRALVAGTIGVTISLATMYAFGGSPVVAAAGILGIGLFGMGMAPSMQHRVAELAGAGGPLAASLPASAVNAGIALGSLTGGLTLDLGGVRAVALTGAVVAAVCIAVSAATALLHPRIHPGTAPGTHAETHPDIHPVERTTP
jgi:DHA1 family inner membrane transport protein